MKFLRVLTLLLVTLLPLAGPVRAEFGGSAEWGYAEYHESRKNQADIDARALTQQYSLLWQKKGTFYNGKGGRYDLALGGEWSWFDTEVNNTDIDLETFKVLYNGNILLAPGGLPFRLELFSHDDHRTVFEEDTIPLLSHGEEDPIEPDIVTDLTNGQHIVTGGTLLIGIRNGSYLGRYRDVLSQLPRLLIDYRQIYVRDVHTDSPQHYRERDLAFVSLNKKDNWFHYRYTDFQDFMDPTGASDYVEKSYMLGTIDHQLQRRWINITNWIQISADGTYTVTEHPNFDLGEPVRRYDLNLFSRFTRSNWDGSNFTSYQRRVDSQSIRKQLEVPVFARGELDRNTAWRFQFIGSKDQEIFLQPSLLALPESNEDVAYMAMQVEAFRQSRYIFAPKFEVETKGGQEGKGYAVRGSAEFYSNIRYRPKYEIYGSYSLARFDGENQVKEKSGSWEQEAVGRIETQYSPRVRLAAEQRFVYSSDSSDVDISNYIRSSALSQRSSDVGVDSRIEGSSFRSVSMLRGELSSGARLRNSLELIFDYFKDDMDSSHQLIGRHRLNFSDRKTRVYMTNEIIQGEVGNLDAFALSVLDGTSSVGDVKTTFSHSTRASYSPGRAWEVEGSFRYEWNRGDLGNSGKIDLSQSATYNFFVVNGLVRKLALLKQTLEYEQIDGASGFDSSGYKFTLLGEYYPTRQALLGLQGTYEHLNPGEDTCTMLAVAALNFEKFQVRLEYEYGTDDDQDAQRWEVNVRKIF